MNLDNIKKRLHSFEDTLSALAISTITDESFQQLSAARVAYSELITAYEKQKARADHTYKQVPALKKRIVELELQIAENE